jgi:adenylyl-sulfate kinase
MKPKGHVFWLFGLSGAGKSTLAELLANQLREKDIAVLILDGDTLRAGLCRGLGFSDSDRAENLRRAAEAAKLGTASGLCVVASFITPLESHRRLITEILGRRNLSLVHVSAPLEVCQSRDTKGLYARAQTGQVAQMTGLSSAFEPPASTDLVIPTASEDITACSAQLLSFALARLDPPRD